MVSADPDHISSHHRLHAAPAPPGIAYNVNIIDEKTFSCCHPRVAAPSVNIIDADANYTGANRSTVNQIDDAARWAAIATSPPLPQQHKRED